MSKIEVDLVKCQLNNITPSDYVLIHLMYHRDYKRIEGIFTRKGASEIKNGLIGSKYILSGREVPFKETILSLKNVKSLLNIKDDTFDFWKWYSIYPHKVGSRILRATTHGSKAATDHEKKYRRVVKSIEHHDEICKRTENYVESQRIAEKLPYLPAILTVLNGRLWEQWDDIEKEEDAAWNQTLI